MILWGGGAWPFLVGGAICLVNSVNERDLSLLTSYAEVTLRGQLLRAFTWNLSPLRPSKFSFEYLLLPPRSALEAVPLKITLGASSLVTSTPAYLSRLK